MDKPNAARSALQMQDACNLTGILASMHDIGLAYLHDGGTDAANTSAPMRLAMHQAVYLSTGKELLEFSEYSALTAECKRIAEGA